MKQTPPTNLELRTLVPPPQLAGDPDLAAAWGRLSYTHQREWATSIKDAKRPETRQRHLTQLRTKLLG